MDSIDTTETLQEDTIPDAKDTSETAETEENAAEPKAEETEAEQSESAENSVLQDSEFLEVKFNKEYKSLNRDEAVKYAQMGMNYERFEPMISKLDYLAAINGVTREQFIDRQLKAQEDSIRQGLVERFGSDEKTINELFEYTKQKQQEAYGDMIAKQNAEEKAAEERTETRLAEEFARLCEEFPELNEKGFRGLPKQVKRAGFNGENLLNAYLQYKHKEAKNIAAARKQAEQSAQKSVGSMGTQANVGNSTGDAFLRGLLRK